MNQLRLRISSETETVAWAGAMLQGRTEEHNHPHMNSDSMAVTGVSNSYF